MQWLMNLFTGGIGATAQGISRAVATFTGDKVQTESNIHDEAMAVHAAYASENSQFRANRTWWDSLWDGLNRAPRPLLTFAVMGLLAWPIFDPVAFAAAMQAYALVPEWLAYVFLAIIGFYFTARHLEKVKLGGGPSPAQVQAILDTQRNIRALDDEPEEEGYQPSVAEPDEVTDDFEDGSLPLSNEAVMEWNRRRKAKTK